MKGKKNVPGAQAQLQSRGVQPMAHRLHVAQKGCECGQHKVVDLLKMLLSFNTKFSTKFYYLDMYIFYISDHKLGTCSTI